VPVTRVRRGHARKPRAESTVSVGTPLTPCHAGGATRDAILYTQGGALCGELTEGGDVTLIPLEP